MPSYIFNGEVWALIWPVPLFAILMAGLFSLLGKLKYQGFLIIFAFSMLGVVVGMLAGMNPDFEGLLAPVLSFIGGLTIYIVGRENPTGRENKSQVFVILGVLVFSLNLFVGAIWGSAALVERTEAFELHKGRFDEYKQSAEYLKKQATIEVEVNEFRENLGLSPLSNGDK